MEPASVNARWRSVVDYLKSVLKELLPAWLVRKPVDVDVRLVEQPPIRELVGAAPLRRYRGPLKPEANDNRLRAALPPGRLPR